MNEPTLDLRGTFFAVVQTLHEEGIAHAFTGALPVLAWGRTRATTDIDLVVAVTDNWERLSAALARRGITQRKQIGPADTADALPDVAVFFSADQVPVRVDVFIAKTDFERAVIHTAREAVVLGSAVRLAAPEASISTRSWPIDPETWRTWTRSSWRGPSRASRGSSAPQAPRSGGLLRSQPVGARGARLTGDGHCGDGV